jgi:hypothetical protein
MYLRQSCARGGDEAKARQAGSRQMIPPSSLQKVRQIPQELGLKGVLLIKSVHKLRGLTLLRKMRKNDAVQLAYEVIMKIKYLTR